MRMLALELLHISLVALEVLDEDVGVRIIIYIMSGDRILLVYYVDEILN